MDERDGWIITFCVLGLAVSAVLTSRILRVHNEALIAQGEDIAFLRAWMRTVDAERAE